MLLRFLFSAVACVASLLIPSDAFSAENALPAQNSPAILPGRGLAHHPFFYAGEWNHPNPDQTMYIVRDGKVVWSYSMKLKSPSGGIQEYSDATLLSNGNILFARMS